MNSIGHQSCVRFMEEKTPLSHCVLADAWLPDLSWGLKINSNIWVRYYFFLKNYVTSEGAVCYQQLSIACYQVSFYATIILYWMNDWINKRNIQAVVLITQNLEFLLPSAKLSTYWWFSSSCFMRSSISSFSCFMRAVSLAFLVRSSFLFCSLQELHKGMLEIQTI